jgi:hypothetical protein
MNTGGSNFDLIMQELLKQKQILEDLEAENQELCRQLAELREGRGIYVEILGTRFALHAEAVVSPDAAVAEAEIPEMDLSELAIDETPTTMIEALPSTTPIPQLTQSSLDEEVEDEEDPLSLTPAFMEEMLIEEFTSASSNPMATWSAPGVLPAGIDEEQKATLRRELMGSFLLE